MRKLQKKSAKSNTLILIFIIFSSVLVHSALTFGNNIMLNHLKGIMDSSKLKEIVDKFMEAVSKESLIKLNHYHTNHCSHLDKDKLTYSHERLIAEDTKLASFLNFTRNDPGSIPLEQVKIADILSFIGWLIFLIPIFFTGASCVSFILSTMFFYCPRTYNNLSRCLLN